MSKQNGQPVCCLTYTVAQEDVVRVSGAQTPSQARLAGRRIRLVSSTCDICGRMHVSARDVAKNQERAQHALRGLAPLAFTNSRGE